MTPPAGPHFLRLPTTRAAEERKAKQPLTAAEYEQLHAMVPGVALSGAPFDEWSRVHPLEVPASPRVVVFEEDPRRVSVGLVNGQGRFVGVVGGRELEAACLDHPGTFLYAVGTVVERSKNEGTFLNLRPRGWVLVELGEAPPPRARAKGRKK